MTVKRPETDEDWDIVDSAWIAELERHAARIKAAIEGGKLTRAEMAVLRAYVAGLQAQLEFLVAPDEATAVRKVLGDLASKEGQA